VRQGSATNVHTCKPTGSALCVEEKKWVAGAVFLMQRRLRREIRTAAARRGASAPLVKIW
jgi:hypothetical protein